MKETINNKRNDHVLYLRSHILKVNAPIHPKYYPNGVNLLHTTINAV